MRGYPEYNFPEFFRVADELRSKGYKVFNPAENDMREGFDPKNDPPKTLREYMIIDLPAVLNSDAVAVLPGWRKSVGAKLEVHVATVCELPILNAYTLEPEDETILEEASRLVGGDRQKDYGHPYDDFSRTASLWTAIFSDMLRDGYEFIASDVATAQRMVKESRLRNSPRHRDSLVDICGYARTQELVWEREII